MPTYTIDIDGVKHKLEADKPLSDDDISDYVDSVNGKKTETTKKTTPDKAVLPATQSDYLDTLGRGLGALGHAGYTLAKGAVLGTIGPNAGAFTVGKHLLQGRGVEEAMLAGQDVNQGVQSFGDVEGSPEYNALMSGISKPMTMAKESLGNVGGKVGKALGNEALGSTIGEYLPDAILAGVGAKSALGMKGAMKSAAPLSQLRQDMAVVQKNGFLTDPMISNPTLTNTVVVNLGNREGVEAALADKNVKHSGDLVKQELGIPVTERLDRAALDKIRGTAEQKYEAVRGIPGDVPLDQQYLSAIAGLDKKFKSMKEFAPELYFQPNLERTRSALSNPASTAHPGAFTPEAILDISQNLRRRATNLLKKADSGDEDFHEAAALKEGATAMEDLLERHLTPQGTQRVATNFRAISDFRDARKLLAKIHNIEESTNLDTGVVNPSKLGKMRANGEKLSGNLDKIAHAWSVMPEAMTPLSASARKANDAVRLSDVATAGILGGTAHALSGGATIPASVLGLAARPAARHLASSKLYQKHMAKVNTPVARPSFNMGQAAKTAGATETINQAEDESSNR